MARHVTVAIICDQQIGHKKFHENLLLTKLMKGQIERQWKRQLSKSFTVYMFHFPTEAALQFL